MGKLLSADNRMAILYALPFLAHALAMTPLITFIPAFYSGEHGLPLALVGAIIFAARLFDIVVEPTVGILSDRTRTPWGRRKPWIIGGLPVLMLGCWMTFAPPVKVDALYAAFWIALTFIAFNILDTPYKAWGAELSKTYMGRARVAGWREGFGIASSMLALVLIFAMQRAGQGQMDEMLFWLAAGFVAAMPILFAITLWLVPEPPIEDLHIKPPGFLESFQVVAQNKPFMILIAGLGVFMTGAIIGASLHMIVMDAVFDARDLFPIILGLENVAGLISVPIWLWVARRIGKHRAVALAAAWMAAWSAPIPLLRPDQAELYGACIVIRGLAGGALAVMIGAMIADVVDIDTLKTGQARNGLYFAMVGMIGKVGIAFGALLGTSLPALFGFENASGANSDAALFALLASYAWVPMLLMGLAAPVFWVYPLTEERQKTLRAEIDARAAAPDRDATPQPRTSPA
jgi:GPH family glycoside/pentoside/hexuronide:cation symporter